MNSPIMLLHNARRKAESVWVKNGPDIRAVFSGTMPRFLKATTAEEMGNEIPVFTYHSVEPELFETHLHYLAENSYTTLDATQLEECIRRGTKPHSRTIALTFDDATGSFWAVAFPLLKKYNFCAILFVIPGLVPDETQSYPNLEDVWNGQVSYEEIINRERTQPLCTWSELLKMHQSGFVDIQGHTLTHSRINISSRVVDFIHPEFDPCFFNNIDIPVPRDDSAECPARRFRLGQPIYESASRLSGKARFLEDTHITECLVDYVQEQGKEALFSQSNWRGILYKEYHNLLSTRKIQPKYESQQQIKAAISLELTRSKELLEQRLPDKIIEHLCYPWFQGSLLADRVASECGYRSVYYGLETSQDNSSNSSSAHEPLKIRRIA
ncbi:MAG TPA: polysaccharide deacetylase family protein, partial [Anaerolineae bacterium]|nr:polysaccharide deacetylase family protein [Anaerolineae bacterium]